MLAAIAISGFIGLAYEVAWTRVLAMVIGPTSYAFSGMLVTFIAGIALGATVGASLARRMTHPIVGLAATFLIGAAGAGVALMFIGRGPLIVGGWVARPDANFGWIVGAELALTAALLLPITLALGAAFPLALQANVSAGRGGSRTAPPRAMLQQRRTYTPRTRSVPSPDRWLVDGCSCPSLGCARRSSLSQLEGRRPRTACARIGRATSGVDLSRGGSGRVRGVHSDGAAVGSGDVICRRL